MPEEFSDGHSAVKGSQTKAELFKERTVRETFLYIKHEQLESIAAFALCFLGTLPVLCAIADHYFKSGLMVLYRVNSSVGYLGLIFGIFIIIWRHYQPEKPPLKERIRGKGLPIFLALMLLWSCFSCIFSTNPLTSFIGDWYRLDGLLSYFAYAGIFIFATQIRRRKCWRTILNYFTAAAAVLALICLLDIRQLNFFLNTQSDKAIFFNVNHYGYYLCMALPAAVGLLAAYKPSGRKAKDLLCLSIYSAEIMLLTNSLVKARSMGPFIAVLGYFAGFIILCFFVDKAKLRRVLCALGIFVLIVVLSSPNTWNIVKDFHRASSDMGTVAESVIGNSAPEDEAALNDAGSGLGALWVNALRFVRERPIFGYGPDNLGEVYTQAGCKNDRPHCEVLQFAASLGIPSAVFYIAGLLCLLLEFIKKFRNLSIEVLAAFSAVGSYLISSTVGNTMFYTSPFFFMLLGMAYGLIKTIPAPVKSKSLPADR